MQCVILAGGLGTRLGALTAKTPKALVLVGGEPFAHWQMAWLASQGVQRVVYCVGHYGKLVEEYVGDGTKWGVQVVYSHDGSHLLGTGGALYGALTRGLLDSSFVVIYGDTLLNVRLAAVVSRFGAYGLPILMTVYRNCNRLGASNVILEGRRVVAYMTGGVDDRTSGAEWIDYGASVLSADALTQRSWGRSATSLGDVFAWAAARGDVGAYRVRRRFYEIGTSEGLAALERKLGDGRLLPWAASSAPPRAAGNPHGSTESIG